MLALHKFENGFKENYWSKTENAYLILPYFDKSRAFLFFKLVLSFRQNRLKPF